MNKTTPPLVQSIFDAIDAYVTSESASNCNAAEYIDGTGKRFSITVNDAVGNTASYQTIEPFSRVALTPASSQLSPGGTQQFAVTATRPDGTVDPTAPVFSIMPSDLGAIAADGTYTAPATMAFQSAVTVRADVGQAYGSASILLLTV